MTEDGDGGDRKSVASPPEIITDPVELTRKEASNALLQADAVTRYIHEALSDTSAFKLRPSILLSLNQFALEGISGFAGNYRPAGIYIVGSKHKPPPRDAVPGLVESLCDYVNENFQSMSALRLAAYVMWRINWIHPFDDGNGRTARSAAYLVLCSRLGYRLPGKKSLLDLIVDNKQPYYAALEAADAAWTDKNRIDVSELEGLLERLLGAHLVGVLEEAKGQPLA